VLCVNCGHENPKGSNYCENCWVQLPKLELFQVFQPNIISDRLRKIEGAVQKLQAGEMSVPDFSDFVRSTYESLVQKSLEIQELVDSSCYYEISPEEVEIGYEGMYNYEAGLQEMYQYAEDQDSIHLVQGMEMMIKGNECINEAMRINRENRDNDGVVGTL